MAYVERYGSRKAPLSSHPLFPAIIALWFAALFGFGCMVLPATLLERAVAASGIAGIVTAAAPPLGITARIAISLGTAGIGALAGYLLARRLAAVHGPEQADTDAHSLFPSRDARRPISASEELDEAPMETAEQAIPTLARLSRIVTDDDWPLDDQPPKHEPEGEREPLDLAFYEMLPPQPEPSIASKAGTAEDWPETPAAQELPETMPEAGEESEAGEEPLPFSAPSEARTAPEPEPVAPEAAMAGPASAEPAPASAELLTASPVAVPAAPAPDPSLDNLNMAELAERLAVSLDRRRSPLPPIPNSLAAVIDDFLAAYADEEEQAETGLAFEEPEVHFAPPPPVIPDALRPIPFDLEEFGEDEDEDETAFEPDFTWPEAVDSADIEEETADNQTASEEAYGSLLALRDPPPGAAVAPGSGPGASPPASAHNRVEREEAERALRDALSTLQRLSGAA